MAAQDQALLTRNYKIKIIREQGTSKSQMCGKRDKTVMHIFNECERLPQIEYIKDITRLLLSSTGSCATIKFQS